MMKDRGKEVMGSQDAKGLVLITGAAKRIGKAVAEGLHQYGYDVALHYLCLEKEANALVHQFNQVRPNSAKAFRADFADIEAVEHLAGSVLAWKSQLSVLINNASMFEKDAGVNGDTMFHVNVRAPYRLSQLMASTLKEENGSIINMLDIHAEIPLKEYDLYCMSKASLMMQSRSLACSLAPRVRVNSIMPGAILWPEKGNVLDENEKNDLLDKMLLHNIGGTEAIVKAVIYLLDNVFVTGSKMVVDGGCSLAMGL